MRHGYALAVGENLHGHLDRKRQIGMTLARSPPCGLTAYILLLLLFLLLASEGLRRGFGVPWKGLDIRKVKCLLISRHDLSQKRTLAVLLKLLRQPLDPLVVGLQLLPDLVSGHLGN